MPTPPRGARDSAPSRESAPAKTGPGSGPLLDAVLGSLDDAKAEDIVTIDLKGKSSLGDFMVVAQGRSNRHVAAIADQLTAALKESGFGPVRVEGLANCDWVLVDAGDVIVHIFRPEVRDFYKLEKMWLAERPPEQAAL